MVLLAAVVFPHGAMPFDGDPQSESSACRERHAKLDPPLRDNLEQLYKGMCEASKAIAELRPELIILHTPHGIKLSDSYAVYFNAEANGNAEWKDCWSEFKTKVRFNPTRARELKEHLCRAGVKVEGLTAFGGLETPLRWAEVIPAWFLNKFLEKDVDFVIVSEDSSTMADKFEDWRLDVGKSLAAFVNALPERTVVVVSGDTSHHHPTDCTNQLYLPHPRMPFPVNRESSSAFETSIKLWVNSTASDHGSPAAGPGRHLWNPDASLPYLKDAVALHPISYACGIKGFIVLHGLLASETRSWSVITSEVVVHRVPTYYGMMVALFRKQ